MKEPWDIPLLWDGGTVAIFGSGPNMSQSVADSLRHFFPCIAVNWTFKLAPWADMMVALDVDEIAGGNLWEQAQTEFSGIKVCGYRHTQGDAFYYPNGMERVMVTPGHISMIRNSGLAAIRIAVEAGAKKILLFGFSPETGGHYAGYPGDEEQDLNIQYPGLAAAFKTVIAELQDQGIEVEMN